MPQPETPHYTPIYRVHLVREAAPLVIERQITGPTDAAAVIRQLIGDGDREIFVIAGLSVKNEVIGLSVVSIGTLDSTIVHPREVFKPALLMNAHAVILAHNHPSGDPEPSPQDLTVSRRLAAAAQILGIELCDHLILGADKIVSLRERGVF